MRVLFMVWIFPLDTNEKQVVEIFREFFTKFFAIKNIFQKFAPAARRQSGHNFLYKVCKANPS